MPPPSHLTAPAERTTHLLERLEGLAGRRLGALILFCVALGVYALEAVAWPLMSGRDLDEYLLAYVQLTDSHPLLPWALLFRTPVTPVVAGGILDLGGGILAEPLAAVLYAGSIVAWSAAALAFGRRAALAVAAALLVYPGYALMFHELASEIVMAAAFAGWAVLVVRAAWAPSARAFGLAGLGVALLALIRPGNVMLLGLVALALVLRAAWRTRIGWAAAFLAAAALPLAAWAVNNGVRYGEWTLARGGNAVVPFYRAFVTDRIISPDNGPASRRLAEAVRTNLLTREPYRSYGVTMDDVFTSGSFRIHEDLYVLSDQVFGWNSAYSTLRDAAFEGIQAHPATYASGVATTVWQQLWRPAYRTPAPTPAPAAAPRGRTTARRGALPPPTEGEPIPAGQNAWISRSDGRIRQVWTSPTDYRFEFLDPADRPRFRKIVSEEGRLEGNLPDRRGNQTLLHRLNQLSRWFPRPVLWLLLGAVAVGVRRPRGAAALVALALSALAVVVFNALGLFTDAHFVLPVAPAFVLFGLAGLLGERRRAADSQAERTRPA
ncbi:MAG: hypothetical protein ACRDLU_00345 [Gaiellaceae bacterium]